ncbi:MAG TPA: glycosyltransferase family 39 protein [Steroidobacteraceae bacterium]|nr:glycosyltransferase family 39 protein [Steroidobacteraceae bacterium]
MTRHGPGKDRLDWGFRALLVVACLVLYLAGSSGTSVFDSDEARFALAVKEMSARGDWVVPSNFGEPRYNKPILSYWLALASTRLLGMNEFALRLPSALCCIFAVLVTMAVAQRTLSRRAAHYAGIAVATSLYVVIEARSLTADASLLAATTASFWAWSRLRERPPDPLRWQVLLWSSVGFGLLAKVVNVAFIGAAACALTLIETSWSGRTRVAIAVAVLAGAIATTLPRCGWIGPSVLGVLATIFLLHSLLDASARAEWRRLGAAWGIPLAALMFLAWGLPAALATHGGFVAQGLGHHLLARTATPFEGHSGWPGYYLVATFVAFFPWASFLPAAVTRAWCERRDPWLAFLLAWTLGPLVLVELTTSKLPHYLLVAFPAISLLVAMLIDGRSDGNRSWTRRERVVEAAVFAALCGCVAVASGYVAASFGSASVRAPAAITAAVAIAVAAAVVRSWLHEPPRRLLARLAGGVVILYLAVFAVLLPALEPLRLAPQLGAAVAQRLEPGERLVLCRIREASVGFYLPRVPDATGDLGTVTLQLRSSPRDALVLVPDDERGLPARLQAGEQDRWERLEAVDGIVLPELSLRRMLVLRRHGNAGVELPRLAAETQSRVSRP